MKHLNGFISEIDSVTVTVAFSHVLDFLRVRALSVRFSFPVLQFAFLLVSRVFREL